ncbi:MAG: alpha/beta hydrolase [Burkholderiaceae bacterium]
MHLAIKSALLVFAGLIFFGVAGMVAIWAPDKSMDQLKARWARPPSRFVSIGGLQVHLRDEGPAADPVPLVLIHGTSDSLHTWDAWTEVLQRTHRVIRFDLPGFGLTGPDPNDDYSMARYVRFVAAVLDDLGVRRCVLVGNSLGGQIAWETALAMPQRIDRLVLVDASGYAPPVETMPLAFRMASIPGVRFAMQYFLPRGLVKDGLRRAYGDPEKVSPALVDRYYDMALRAGNRRALGYRVKAALEAGDSARIRKLKLPTLVLWGGRDHLLPLRGGQQFARDIAGSRLVVFDALGHLPQEEDPVHTLPEVQKFLDAKQPI